MDDVLPGTVRTIYSLTEADYPLLKSAGFKGQGMFWDLMWSTDRGGTIWQVSIDSDEYMMFYEHGEGLRPASPRTMTRQEFQQRFGV